MDDRSTDWSLDDINGKTVLTAALLVAVGGVVGAAGLVVACAAVVAAGRRWYKRVDLPASELARLKWEQARAAAGAGAGAGAPPGIGCFARPWSGTEGGAAAGLGPSSLRPQAASRTASEASAATWRIGRRAMEVSCAHDPGGAACVLRQRRGPFKAGCTTRAARVPRRGSGPAAPASVSRR